MPEVDRSIGTVDARLEEQEKEGAIRMPAGARAGQLECAPMEVRKSLLAPHARERMFDLIEQAEHYPRFLPWCAGATILERSDELVAATIHVDFKGVRFHFTTKNPKRRPEWLAFRLAEGPFRHFDGEWNLAPLGDAGCRIEFVLRYEFDSTLMRKLAGPVFDRIADTLVDRLAAEADALYGGTAGVAAQPIALVPSPTAAPAAAPGPAPSAGGDATIPASAPSPAAAPDPAAAITSLSRPGANSDG